MVISRTPLHRARRLALVGALLFVSACSGSDTNPDGTDAPVPGTAVELDDDVIIATDDGEIPSTTTDPPVEPGSPDAPPDPAATTTAAPVELPAPDAVGRIVSMSPSHTETLFALGLGDVVVAVDSESDFPPEADAVRRDDLQSGSADLTALLAFEPDVVVIGDDPTGLADRLAGAGVASYRGAEPASLDELYAQIRAIAAIVGRPDLAETLIADMESEIDEIVSALPPRDGLTYFHEIDPSLVTITPGTLLDSLYGALGLSAIVDADPSGFTQVTQADVVAADPDVIVLADAECCGVSIDTIARRSGWAALSAVSSGAVVEVPDDLVMRWGPRVVDLIRLVADAVAAAA